MNLQKNTKDNAGDGDGVVVPLSVLGKAFMGFTLEIGDRNFVNELAKRWRDQT